MSNPPDQISDQLVAGLVAAFPGYVWRKLDELRVVAVDGMDGCINAAAESLNASLSDLVRQGLTEQRQSPLELVRRATVPVARLLRSLGLRPADRDEWQLEVHPDDPYGLFPASPAELGDDALHLTLEWGQRKAAVITGESREPVLPKWPAVALFGVPAAERDHLAVALADRGFRVLVWRNPASLEAATHERPVLVLVDRRHPAAAQAIRELAALDVRVIATDHYIDDMIKPGLLALGADDAIELSGILARLDSLLPRLS